MERIEGLTTGDGAFERRIDRRERRSDNITQALRYVLDACREASRLEAMALADRDGLRLATAGDPAACEEVAARVAGIPIDVGSFRGTVIGEAGTWQVHMRRLRLSALDGISLYICAVGGGSDERTRAVARAGTGIERILR